MRSHGAAVHAPAGAEFVVETECGESGGVDRGRANAGGGIEAGRSRQSGWSLGKSLRIAARDEGAGGFPGGAGKGREGKCIFQDVESGELLRDCVASAQREESGNAGAADEEVSGDDEEGEEDTLGVRGKG